MSDKKALKNEQTENGSLDKLVALQTMYVKDVSFEAPNSPGVFLETNINPETKINLSNMHTKVGDNSFDVALKVKVESSYEDKTIFIAEIEQGGVFTIKGYSDEETKALIAVFCPNTLFPFIRELVASLVSKAGFPALLLQPINFESLYSQAKEEAEEEKPN